MNKLILNTGGQRIYLDDFHCIQEQNRQTLRLIGLIAYNAHHIYSPDFSVNRHSYNNGEVYKVSECDIICDGEVYHMQPKDDIIKSIYEQDGNNDTENTPYLVVRLTRTGVPGRTQYINGQTRYTEETLTAELLTGSDTSILRDEDGNPDNNQGFYWWQDIITTPLWQPEE